MRALSGKICALTGAASGIGRRLAPKLVDEGCNPALADFNENGVPPLPETEAEAHIINVSSINGIAPSPNEGSCSSSGSAAKAEGREPS